MLFVTLHQLFKSVKDTESAWEYNILKYRNFYHFYIRLKSSFLEPFSFAIVDLYLRFSKKFSHGINRSLLFLYYTGNYYKIRVVKEKQVFHCLLPIFPATTFNYAGNVISSKRSTLLSEYVDLLLLIFYKKNCYNGFQNSPSHLRKLIILLYRRNGVRWN
jgi:hypothetical protein